MGSFEIIGGNKISGEVRVGGAKNSVLPIMAATVLNGKMNILHDIPRLSDVEVMTKILVAIGCEVKREGNTILVDSSGLNKDEIPEEWVREMRSSIIFLGAMLSRCGRVVVSYPGGCEIGPRPIDLHLRSLKELGAKIEEKHGFLICEARDLKGAEIQLDFPSVGATENLILSAVFAKGTTIVRNAAREPEIVDLANFINAMGGKVSGAGSATVIIEGVTELSSVEHQIIPDRIVAGTYLTAAAITGGEITLTNVIPEHVQSVIYKLKESGCHITVRKNILQLTSPERITAIDTVKTLPYPGFPTDMQSQLMALMAVSDGITIFVETIFENRFKHVEELLRMGANIKVDGRLAVVKGTRRLTGATVTAKDLRGGAALVLAALAAEGKTTVSNVKHVERGYDHFHQILKDLGGNITLIE